MKFCSICGGNTEKRIPEGDSRERDVCIDCGEIHYSNPKIIAGCVPYYGDRVLLCKRAIEPRYGYWTLPAGFMENQETTQEGAIRETWEEAQAKVSIDHLYRVFNVPQISQVYMLFKAELTSLDFGPGEESLEVQLFKEDEIPWDDLAFHTVHKTLKAYFADAKTGEYNFEIEDLIHGERPTQLPY